MAYAGICTSGPGVRIPAGGGHFNLHKNLHFAAALTPPSLLLPAPLLRLLSSCLRMPADLHVFKYFTAMLLVLLAALMARGGIGYGDVLAVTHGGRAGPTKCATEPTKKCAS